MGRKSKLLARVFPDCADFAAFTGHFTQDTGMALRQILFQCETHLTPLSPTAVLGDACDLQRARICGKAFRPQGDTPPDFTQGGRPSYEHDWTLGPTGARGWIHSAHGHSRATRQILVTAVAEDSPAQGVLEVGDVILGMGATPFTEDARITLAKAITAAEAADGTLRLLRWRAGQTSEVAISLPVLGSYSATAPYDCEKSRRIFDLGCASLARRMAAAEYAGGIHPIPRALNALALLASGNKDHLPLIKSEAEWAAGFTTSGYVLWFYGFMMMFLSEYVMAAGDDSVRPGLERIALETARGASRVGTWGHRFAEPDGNLEGYGAMNAAGLPLTIGMILAREAGVRHPEIDAVISKSAAFLRWYVGKGAVPYGDHPPYPLHDDNGKCAGATVLFDLLGDAEAAAFFSKMSTAAYSERECGHTGNYFNLLWAMQGVARCGPLATGAYWQEQSWYYDLARDHDTRYLYQGAPRGEEEGNKYTGWDSSGSYLLDLALPLKSLHLTGRKPFSAPPLDRAHTAEVIAAGREYPYRHEDTAYDQRSLDELLSGLTNWSPSVRRRSAAALGKREGDHVPALLKQLSEGVRDTRCGAVEALGALGPRADAAAPALRAALRDPDPWVQCLAAMAIPKLGPEARTASVSDLLSLAMREDPADPRRHAALYAGSALFSPFPGTREPVSILGSSLEGVDRDLLYPAISALLGHSDSLGRSFAGKTYPNLTDRDLVALLPDIAAAIVPLAPSNEMRADGVRLAGLDLLSRLRIREGMELCVAVMQPERWSERKRTPSCLEYLQRYGAHAQPLLPRLREIRTFLAKKRNAPPELLKQFDDALAAIESSTEKPTLVNLAEFKEKPVR